MMRYWRIVACTMGVVVLLAGCSASSGSTSLLFSPRNADTVTLRLVALPTGYAQAISVDPTSTQLAQILGHPGDAALLVQDGRTGGSYRVFVFTTPEPSTLTVVLRLGIEIDYFTTSSGANAWLATRQTNLAGPVLPVGGPGQRHVTRMQSYSAGGSTDSRVVLAFVQSNVYIEVATDSIGPGASFADAENYGNVISQRLLAFGSNAAVS